MGNIDDLAVEYEPDDQGVYYTEDFDCPGDPGDDYVEYGQDFSKESCMTMAPIYGHGCFEPQAVHTHHYNGSSTGAFSSHIVDFEVSSKSPIVNSMNRSSETLGTIAMEGVNEQQAAVREQPQQAEEMQVHPNPSSTMSMYPGRQGTLWLPYSADVVVLSIEQFLANRNGVSFEYAPSVCTWAVQCLRGSEYCAFLLYLHVPLPMNYTGTVGSNSSSCSSSGALEQQQCVQLVGRCVYGDLSVYTMFLEELQQALCPTGSTTTRSTGSPVVGGAVLPPARQSLGSTINSNHASSYNSNAEFLRTPANLPILDNYIFLVSTGSARDVMHNSSEDNRKELLQAVQLLNDLVCDVTVRDLLLERGAVQALVMAFNANTKPESAGTIHDDLKQHQHSQQEQEQLVSPYCMQIRTFAIRALAALSSYRPALLAMMQSEELITHIVRICNMQHLQQENGDYDAHSFSDNLFSTFSHSSCGGGYIGAPDDYQESAMTADYNSQLEALHRLEQRSVVESCETVVKQLISLVRASEHSGHYPPTEVGKTSSTSRLHVPAVSVAGQKKSSCSSNATSVSTTAKILHNGNFEQQQEEEEGDAVHEIALRMTHLSTHLQRGHASSPSISSNA